MTAPVSSQTPGVSAPAGLASSPSASQSAASTKPTGLIELRAVCSNQVKKGALKVIDNVVAWPVDPTKPFNHDVNFGKFTTSLNIFSPCELCHYYEGRIGDVIDLSKTPDELGYRPRMTVYVRVKKSKVDTGVTSGELLGVRLSSEEEKLMRRLRMHVLPNLGPDDACPLCSRVETQVGDSQGNLASGVAKLTSNASSSVGAAQNSIAAAKLRPEIGIQCGSASRLDEDFMQVRFGQTARLQEARPETMVGGPRGFGGGDRGTGSGGGGGGGERTGPSPGTGFGFVDIDGAVVNFKSQLEKVTKERDQLVLELREMTKSNTRLEQWRAQHRCEGSGEVAKLREDYESIQTVLRELVRGREEVFGALQTRRSVGLGLADTPRQYAPLKNGAPVLEPFTPQAKQLLSKVLGAGAGETESERRARGGGGDDEGDQGTFQVNGTELSKRPSGGTKTGKSDPTEPNMQNDRAPGQCMLKVTSTTGDSFYVRRRIGSEVRGGRHFLYLLSLDGTLTDEIFVPDLQAAGVEGPYGFRLATSKNEFMLYLHPSERQRWVHWVYALAPFLAANTADAANSSIPANY